MVKTMFDIPVVLFFMKRTDNTLKVLSRIAEVKPSKLYLISDAGRTPEEQEKVLECRKAVEDAITWPCEVVRDYAEDNRGILDRIGMGARRVLEKEQCAIFLEDDNYPEVSFFEYCKQMLRKYENDNRILWICGTNYLEEYNSPYDYVFTKHTLPCGWASWSQKFLEYYDGYLTGLDNDFIANNYRNYYEDKRLEKQKVYFIRKTKKALTHGNNKTSWDHQMTFSLMANRLYGIAPCVNLIKNIGVDADTTHGGSTMANIMTRRFCGMESKPISFPINHPPQLLEDKQFEKLIGNIIRIPRWYMMGIRVAAILRKIFKSTANMSYSQLLFDRKRIKNDIKSR